MTCIAFDGKTLAGDKRATNCGLARTVTKIHAFQNNTQLVAISGNAAIGAEVMAWLLGEADPEKFPAAARTDETTVLVIERSEGGKPVVRAYTSGPYATVFEDEQIAIGCGRDYALAAMTMGADARRAVEIACQFDVNCGNGIDTLELA